MNKKKQGFKRLHFFKMFLTEEDWNSRHQYHFEKNEFHNQVFHGHGPSRFYKEGLNVTQRPRPQMSIEIRPGYAVDADGRDILLEKMIVLPILPQNYRPNALLRVVCRQEDKPVQHIRFRSGRRVNRYFEEKFTFEVIDRRLRFDEIELARIRIDDDVSKIRDAGNPNDPGVNEIDMRFRQDGFSRQTIDGVTRQRLLDLLKQRQLQIRRLAGNTLLRPVLAVYFFLSVLELMVKSDAITPQGAITLLEGLNFCDQMLLGLIRDTIDDEWVTERPAFQEFNRNMEVVQSLLDNSPMQALNDLEQMVAFASEAAGNLHEVSELYGNESLIFREGQENAMPRVYDMGDDWNFVKEWSDEMPLSMIVDGLHWQLIDKLVIMNEEDEKRFDFRIAGAKEVWRTQQSLTFPDGVEIDAIGVAHKEGFSEFVIKNITPDTDLAIVRMMDYGRGDYEIKIFCNDVFVGQSKCPGSDQRNRWRNWPFVIPAYFVTSDVLKIRQEMTNAERDINMYKYWFYQPSAW